MPVALLVLAAVTGAVSPPKLLNGSEVITDNDYPAAAAATRQQGVTDILLSVDSHGLVTGCRITRSSGSASLDQASCQLFQQRARFAPAVGADGAPAAATASETLHWVLPDIDGPVNITKRSTAMLDAKGTPTVCSFAVWVNGLPQPTVPSQLDCAGFPAAALGPGVAGHRFSVFEQQVVIEDAALDSAPPVTDGIPIRRETIAMTIDPAGLPTSCQVVQELPAAPGPQDCEAQVKGRQQPFPLTSGVPPHPVTAGRLVVRTVVGPKF